MATAPLSDSDLRLLSAQVFSRVFGESTQLARHLEDQLKRSRSLEETVEAVSSHPDVSSQQQTQIEHVGWLYKLSDGSVPIVAFCFSQPHIAGGSVLERQELAERIIAIPVGSRQIPLDSRGAWARLRVQLFAQEPTSVLCGLIRTGVIPAPEEYKELIISFLRVATENFGFDMGKISIRTLLVANDPNTAAIFPAAGISKSQERQAVATYLVRLQKLQALVNVPEDVGPLVKCGYMSAEGIADLGDDAVHALMEQDIPRERAEGILNQARFVAQRSEHLWVKALAMRVTGSNRDMSLAATASTGTATDSATVSAKAINLSSMFGLDSMGCEDCASLTGPAAFLVDLLHQLRYIHVRGDEKLTLLDRLFERRPDLGNLKLSCANTTGLVPYVDLVNEMLESVLWHLAVDNKPLIASFDSVETDKTSQSAPQPQNTNFRVYSQVIEPMVSPMHTFPYNQAVHSIRAYLSALGSSRDRVMSVFRSSYAITSDDSPRKQVRDALDHSFTAELLNLQREDYVAITGQGFYPRELVESLRGQATSWDEYREAIGLKVPSSLYWGFGSNDEMAPPSSGGDSGLAKIKDELLPRSGLEFRDLLTVVQTQYFNDQLVIEIKKKQDGKDPESTEILEYMRLREWSDGRAQLLQASTCDRLQAFLRLRSKLQWPIEELDTIVVTLAKIGRGDIGIITIDPELLDNLAAVKQLAELTSLSPTELQPFWGDINCYGSKSLYAQLFPSASLPAEERALFSPDLHGHIFQTKPAEIVDQDRLAIILMALDLTTAEFESIRHALQVPSRMELTLNNISAFYRVATLCKKILNIPPQAYSDLLLLFPEFPNPFKDPFTTLSLVQRYPPLQPTSKHWTLDRLLFVTQRIPSTADEKCCPTLERHLEITKSIRSSLDNQVLRDIKRKMEDDSALPSLVHDLVGVAEHRSHVLQFVQNSDYTSVRSPEAQHFIDALAPILGTAEASELCKKIIASTRPQSRRLAFMKTFLSARYRDQQVQAILKTLTPFFSGLSLALLRFSLEKLIRIETNGYTISGMDAFLQLAKTYEPTDDRFSGYFCPPTTDVYVIFSAADKKPEGAILDETLLEFKSQKRGMVPHWAASTDPLVGGRWYRLHYKGKASDLSRRAGQAGGGNPTALSRSELVEEHVASNVAKVIVELMRISILVDTVGLSTSEVEFGTVVQSLMAAKGKEVFDFSKSLRLQDIQDLELYLQLREEFSHNGAPSTLLALYKWLFSFANNGTDANITHKEIADQLAQATGWPKSLCIQYLESKYPGYEGERLINLFQKVSTLHQMRQAVSLMRELGLPSLSLKSLFAIARPPWWDLVKTDFNNAAALRLAIQSRRLPGRSEHSGSALSEASDKIRDSQRTALIHALLSTTYAQDKSLPDADQLFGHFLIDVQMGPGLQTSRIKQAISSVQLFVQRCALGLEKGIGIDPVGLGRSDLEYLLRYRLWEADRKVYLYPENWIDPTLRDNKTEQFQAVESKIMQTKLDLESIDNIIKDYVHSVHEISNLRVEAYLVEEVRFSGDKGDSRDHDAIHIFGRTRTSPFKFYYRWVTVSTPAVKEGRAAPNWSPWSKINVDIPVQETDADGKKLSKPGSYLVPTIYNGQLYVFLPEISLVQKPSTYGDKKKYSEIFKEATIAETQPVGLWEIRMGYIKLSNGKWSSRVVSQSVIRVKVKTGDTAPNISHLKFFIKCKKDAPLTINVEWIMSTGYPNNDPLGIFEMRDGHLILVGGRGLPVSEWNHEIAKSKRYTACTTFSRFQREQGDYPNFQAVDVCWGEHDKARLRLGCESCDSIKDQAKNSLCEWSIEFNRAVWYLDSHAEPCYSTTGMFLEVSRSSSISQYIGYPYHDYTFRVDKFWNRISPRLVQTARKDDPLDSIFDCLKQIEETQEDPEVHIDAFGKWSGQSKVHYHEGASPFSLYNWELGVHIPSLILERLMATQQFELALKVAKLMFDPNMDGTNISRCWSFPPFREDSVRTSQFDLDQQAGVDEWRQSGGNVHAAARGRPVAYMKRIAMKYIELLIAIGDDYFRRDSLESIPLAIQMYSEASHVFGPHPVEVPQLGKRADKTYNQIAMDSKGQDALDPLSNATVDMELDFPFYIEPGSRGTNSQQSRPPRSFLKTGYFCIPGNSYPASLQSLINDRLYKIRHGMDINGRKRTLPLFEPPIDPGALAGANSPTGMGIAGLLSDIESPMPRYRFSYLIHRAMEMVDVLKSSGQQLLYIKEKKDAEGLSTLRCRHQGTVLALVKRIKEYQKAEVERAIEALQETRKQQEMHLAYFLALTGDPKEIPQPGGSWQDIPQSIEKPKMDDFRMSPYEQEEMERADDASAHNETAGGIENLAAAAFAIPMFAVKTQPMGVGIDTAIGGQQIGQVLLCAANVVKLYAQRALEDSAKAARKAAAIRQLQERRLEANTIGRELMRIDKDLLQLQSRLDTYDADIQASKQEVDNVAAEEEWLRTKYTSQQLYTLLDNSMGSLFHRTYLMAIEMAKTAKRALDFEIVLRSQSKSSPSDSAISLGGYWENSRDGQLSGESLLLDLKRMESVYIESHTHDFEILKTVSLRQINPVALLTLQQEGAAEFDVPEVLFDMDFPGHYCRRISSVAVSMPCILGPYTSLNCTLSLQQHKYRITSTAQSTKKYAEQAASDFHTDHVPISSIAVSRGMEDSGVLDLDFRRADRYGPFEGAGAISTWRISLPHTHRQFDYNIIADVVLHLRYTAFGSGGLLEKTASASVDAWVKQSPDVGRAYGKGVNVFAIDLKNDYPSEWYRVASAGCMTLQHIDQRLPFWARRGRVTSENISLFIMPKPKAPGEIKITIPGQADTPASEDGKLGDYFKFTFSGKPVAEASTPWTINIKSDKDGFQRGWLVVQYSVS